MSITDKKGINVTSGFKLISSNPIDARYVVEDEEELQSIIDNGAAYNGLEVWVNSLEKKLMYNGNAFIEMNGGEASTIDTEMSDTSTNAVQNKVIKAYVDEQIKNSIAQALQGDY